jgi:nuclear pore complex protein Nup107
VPTAAALLDANPYTSTATLAQAILASSSALQELVVVREWLHETAPPPPAVPATLPGFRRATRVRLDQVRRAAGAARDADALVGVLDPDATSMEPGKALATEDVVGGRQNSFWRRR